LVESRKIPNSKFQIPFLRYRVPQLDPTIKSTNQRINKSTHQQINPHSLKLLGSRWLYLQTSYFVFLTSNLCPPPLLLLPFPARSLTTELLQRKILG
jgi:hypothetical protein